ncbi:MAG: MMPL family transporter [Solirubrobacterales bacterium]
MGRSRGSWAVLGVAALVLVALGVIGTGVESRLQPTTLDIPGTDSSRANRLLRGHFGASMPFAILLRGPQRAIDRQGPELVEALREEPGVTTISPWDRGAVVPLRPGPRRALILADYHVEIKAAVNETVPELERTLEERIRPPVRATQTGFASISRALQERSIAASERGELIAFPFLLLVLLLVFRSPIAAAIPLAFGAITVLSSRGILYLAADWLEIDAFALTVCSMMGLALGVDYALLMVSRFREELGKGVEPYRAARVTRRTAGRTTAFAGSTLLISMLVSIFILPGSLLASLAGTLAMVVVLTVLIATVVAPPALALLGPRIDLWRIGPAPGGRSRLMALVTAALRRPALAAVLIGGAVLVLAAPAVALRTGPPSPAQLPDDDPARADAELIARETAPGYEAPFVVVAATGRGPITDDAGIRELNRFQRRIAELPGVRAVVGPGPVAKRVEPLRDTGNAILANEGNIGPVEELGRLGRELDAAAGGVAQLRAGIAEAGNGAGLLALGADRATEGAQQLATGLAEATDGAEQAVAALERFAKGSRRLAEAQQTASIAELQLLFGIRNLHSALGFNGLPRARKLQKQLNEEANRRLPELIGPAQDGEAALAEALALLEAMTVGRTDPEYEAAVAALRRAQEGYAGLPAALEATRERLLADFDEAKEVTAYVVSTLANLQKLANGAKRLHEGMTELQKAGDRLAGGAERLAAAAGSLNEGLEQLGDGAAELAAGVEALGGGAAALEQNLLAGAGQAAPLQGGLAEASVQVIDGKRRINRRARRVAVASPGLFDSGYFVLSALDGAPPAQRQEIGETVDLEHGGQAASILVVSEYPFNSAGSIELNRELEDQAEALAAATGLRTGVAGGAAQLNDYSRVTRDTIPAVVAGITLATFLVLVVVLRALPLAALAVGLNLLTVGVAFGVLTLLSELPSSFPLGGHEYIDAVGATMIFGIVFGLSIDYAVFLLVRMRERYDRDGDNAAAIEFGLERTARVITGAAAIMMAVFIAFAGSSLATVSQLGIGLTVAVVLDATVVRIVLLPALMLLIGDRVWWLPRRLARVLPKLGV